MRLLFLCLLLASCSPRIPEQPNILLILADDMGYGDLSMAGNKHISTPNLDALSKAGTTFSNFYVSAVCAPTRASLLTGRYHQRTGVHSVTNGWETLDPDEVTLAEALQDEGYRTGIFGKWHLGEYNPSVPMAQGFDEFIGFRTGHTADYYDALLEQNGSPYQTQGHITEVLANEAISFMQPDTQPFFCYLSFNAPHTPLQVDSSWFSEHLANGLDDRTARIYGMVEQLDQQVGKLTTFLEASGKSENTIVIFMSDNGPISGWKPAPEDLRYNVGLRDQKFTTYEGGIRTQSFWVWKNKWQSQKSDQVSAHIDVLPTLMETIGAAPKKDIDGISLTEILSGTRTSLERDFYQQYSLETMGSEDAFPGGMIRRGPWKMINESELYNLTDDPGEQNNVAELHSDTLMVLQASFQEWWSEILQADDFHPDPTPVGLDQENPVHIRPHHGTKKGEATFLGQKGLLGDRLSTHPTGVDGDWISNWKSTSDTIVWQIHVESDGLYDIGVHVRATNNMAVPLELFTDISSEVITINMQKSISWKFHQLETLQLPVGEHTIGLSLTSDLKNYIELSNLSIANSQ